MSFTREKCDTILRDASTLDHWQLSELVQNIKEYKKIRKDFGETLPNRIGIDMLSKLPKLHQETVQLYMPLHQEIKPDFNPFINTREFIKQKLPSPARGVRYCDKDVRYFGPKISSGLGCIVMLVEILDPKSKVATDRAVETIWKTSLGAYCETFTGVCRTTEKGNIYQSMIDKGMWPADKYYIIKDLLEGKDVYIEETRNWLRLVRITEK